MKLLHVILVSLIALSVTNAQIVFDNQASALNVGISYGHGFLGGGVSFYDYNKDGLDDITIATSTGTNCLFYRNTGTNFVIDPLPISVANTQTKQVVWVDYDNDGDMDFFAVGYNSLSRLFRNENDGTFTHVTYTSGLPSSALVNNAGSSWGDYNNDGYLDVFLSVWNYQDDSWNLLYKNNGDGTFTNVTLSAGLYDHGLMTFCSAFFDYDKDGDQDIYIANDKLYTNNILYRNNGDGTFTDVSVASGTDLVFDAMSTTIDDYDNDGWLDIYVTNSHLIGNALLKNNGDGTFDNVTDAAGVNFYSIGWGAAFLDADNDTDRDLYVSGSPDGSTSLISAAFYENNGSGVYTIPTNAGFDDDTRESFSNAIGDVDNDGFPEILVSNNQNEDIFLWKNLTNNSNNWLKVNLEGTQSNRMGIGSWIEIRANGEVQYNYTLCGEGYISQNSANEFFGVGNATTIDYVKVTWLSGQVDYLENVSVNQTLTVVEGSNPLTTEDNTLTNIEIYPNPATDNLIISQAESEVLTITIHSVLGQKVLTTKIAETYNSIDIDALQKGIYLVTIESESGKRNEKLIVH